ncbi:ABC transporter, ATP-binding protein (plasmid) [Calothrix sp. PCC 7716]|nr:ABC transporter, ATP-binding protein [Calothrix sp. PCC 7716]
MTNQLTTNQFSSRELSGTNPILSVLSLGRKVQDRWVWRNLSFELQAGEQVAVVGASGSGKSLLLRALAGLDSVQSGEIIFQGKSINSHFMPQYRSQIIYVQQRPALWEGTVEENIKQVYRLATHRHQRYDRNRILDYLQLFNRGADFLQTPVNALSGGEGQIVAFLRALQLQASILLLDEPTASLDAETEKCLEALVTAWQSEDQQRAYIWTSHNPVQLQRVTRRQISLQENK